MFDDAFKKIVRSLFVSLVENKGPRYVSWHNSLHIEAVNSSFCEAEVYLFCLMTITKIEFFMSDQTDSCGIFLNLLNVIIIGVLYCQLVSLILTRS